MTLPYYLAKNLTIYKKPVVLLDGFNLFYLFYFWYF